MKKSHKLLIGLILTTIIFFISSFFGKKIDIGIDFFATSFGIHSIMLVLSLLAIILMKNYLNFKMKLPKLNTIWRPIFFTIITVMLVQVILTIATKALIGNTEIHPAFNMMNPYQIIVFVFIYASIAEEFLFRGFLMNILKPFQNKGITLAKRHISLPVIISAVAFGLSHLITAKLGVSTAFLFTIVISTSIIGLIAGYYHEKYSNFSYAIIVHMSANLLGVIGAFMMHLNL